MKKLFVLPCVAAAALALSLTGLATSPVTAEQAKAVAERQVPAGSLHLKTEMDDRAYEVSFYHKDSQTQYELDVIIATGKIISFESQRTDHRGSAAAVLTEEAAKKAVTGEFPKADILSARLDYDDGYYEYEVRFRTVDYYGEYTIHAESGAILERDIRIGALPTAAEPSGLISRERARELALAAVPQGLVTDIDLDYNGGVYLYELELYKDSVKYEVTLDATTGALLRNYYRGDKATAWPTTPSTPAAPAAPAASGQYISLERAGQLALARVPGAQLRGCEFEHEDGRAIYEGELRLNNFEYEFEIDAVTGQFLKWKMEYDD